MTILSLALLTWKGLIHSKLQEVLSSNSLCHALHSVKNVSSSSARWLYGHDYEGKVYEVLLAELNLPQNLHRLTSIFGLTNSAVFLVSWPRLFTIWTHITQI